MAPTNFTDATTDLTEPRRLQEAQLIRRILITADLTALSLLLARYTALFFLRTTLYYALTMIIAVPLLWDFTGSLPLPASLVPQMAQAILISFALVSAVSLTATLVATTIVVYRLRTSSLSAFAAGLRRADSGLGALDNCLLALTCIVIVFATSIFWPNVLSSMDGLGAGPGFFFWFCGMASLWFQVYQWRRILKGFRNPYQLLV